MSVFATVVAGNFPQGNPASVNEPRGLWLGQANMVGDGSGGTVELTIVPQNPTDTPTLPDQRREYVYFCDGVEATSQGVDPGNFSLDVFMHMQLSNITLTLPFRHRVARDSVDAGAGIFMPIGPLLEDYMRQTPIFWDNSTLAIAANQLVRIRASINVNLQGYEFNAYGRFYDRQILQNRGFGRLVSPASGFPGG